MSNSKLRNRPATVLQPPRNQRVMVSPYVCVGLPVGWRGRVVRYMYCSVISVMFALLFAVSLCLCVFRLSSWPKDLMSHTQCLIPGRTATDAYPTPRWVDMVDEERSYPTPVPPTPPDEYLTLPGGGPDSGQLPVPNCVCERDHRDLVPNHVSCRDHCTQQCPRQQTILDHP